MDGQMKQELLKAVTLSEALPYIRDFNGKTIIIQFDGLKVKDEVAATLIEDFSSNWASWIRTNEMQESKSCALPLGDSPKLSSGG